MPTVYLSLGSNLGNRHAYIRKAVDALKAGGLNIEKISTLIETDPFQAPPQGPYLNGVLKARTQHSPEELILITGGIEQKLGRVKRTFRGPRVIDIDILLYDDVKLATPRLLLPHPRMLERSFVMQPLEEIAPAVCASLRK